MNAATQKNVSTYTVLKGKKMQKHFFLKTPAISNTSFGNVPNEEDWNQNHSKRWNEKIQTH